VFGFDNSWKDILAGKGLKPIDWREPISDVRKAFWRTMHTIEADAPAMLETRNLTVSGAAGALPARLYVPYAAGLNSPGLVFFHGGGFMVGDLDSHEMLCRRLADAARMRILSVAYRLAPEHKFPAAPEDCIAAARWAFDNAATIGFLPERIAVGGDSAGGNLAAVVTHAFKQAGDRRLKAQLLIYPCTQFLLMTPSQISFAQAFAVTQKAQDWFVDAYLGAKDNAHDWRASPLIADDFAGLPHAMVVTAGLDPLLDEGKAYADKLAASGVATLYRPYPEQVHGFFNFTAVSKVARTAIGECAAWLAKTV
jgi:acetyl esterase